MAERKEWWEILRDQFASRGLLDPESERVQEAVQAAPAVQRQARGLLSLDPQAESDTVREMGLGSLPGVGQAMALRDLERARRAKDPGAAAMAASNFIPFGPLLNRFRRGPMSELDVYHGTPHRFPATEANPLGEFDASKIGTGEGLQAYGHGIYLSESPEVGRQYQQFLAARKNDLSDPGNMAASIMYRNSKGTREAGIAQIDRVFKAMKDYPKSYPDMEEQRAVLQKARELLESGAELPPQGGSFYKADLPDEMIGRMIDWDKPIKDQPAALQSIRMMLPDDLQKDFDVNAATGISGGNAYLNWIGGAKSATEKSEGQQKAK